MEADHPVLTFEDWIPYAPALPEGLDDPTPLIAYRRRLIEHRLATVNRDFNELKEAWPDGTALHFMLASELYTGPEVEFIAKLRDVNFIRKVLGEAKTRGIHQGSLAIPAASLRSAPPVVPLDETDSDSEDDTDSGGARKPKHNRATWSALEMSSFRLILNELSPNPASWKAVARRFTGKTPDDCRYLYRRMRSTNQLDTDLTGPWEDSLPAGDRFKRVTVIQFCYKQMSAWVGPQGQTHKDRAMQNPLLNYVDQMTGNKIIYPAISPDFYLLDYRTWLKVIQEQGADPFSRRHLNKRQLIILNADNINEYQAKIHNLEASKPLHPADDHLEEFLHAATGSNERSNID
jgi:hypothetical protein